MIDLVLVLCMCMVGFLPMYFEHKTKRLDFFNIKNAFILYYIIQLGFSGLISVSLKYPSEIGISPVYFREYYTKAFIVSLVGLIVFQAGYYSSLKLSIKVPDKLNFRWKQNNVYLILLLFFITGSVSFFIFLISNGGISQFLANRGEFRAEGISGQGFLIFPATHVFNLGVIVYAILKINNDGKSNKHILISSILLILTLIPAFLMGFRGLIILPILEYLVVINYRFKIMSFKKLLPIILIIVVSFVGYGVIRELPGNVEITTERVMALVEENPELVYSFVSRSKGTEVLAAELKKLDETNEFDYGYKSLIETFTIFIPGKIWEGKPEPSSVRFTTFFFGDDLAYSRGYKQDSWGGISPTIVGEFYWHFGWLGVICGLFSFGYLVGKIYCTFIKNKTNLFVLLIYAELFPMMIMMAEAVQGYANSIVLYVFAWCFVYVLLKLKFDV